VNVIIRDEIPDVDLGHIRDHASLEIDFLADARYIDADAGQLAKPHIRQVSRARTPDRRPHNEECVFFRDGNDTSKMTKTKYR
jgi:hypothetical protein